MKQNITYKKQNEMKQNITYKKQNEMKHNKHNK